MICLLKELPDAVVIEEILPRLSWDVRPVCRSVSKLWKTTIDTNTEDSEHTNLTRRHQIPLLTGSCVISIIQPAEPSKSWFISKIWKSNRDPSQGRFLLLKDSHGYTRQLPPVKLFPGASRLAFWNGIVCVWTVTKVGFYHDRDKIFKLDIGAGKWTWKSVQVKYVSAWTDFVSRNGNIYATPRIATYSEDDDGICFNGNDYLYLPTRSRHMFWDRFVDYGVEITLFTRFYQIYDMRHDIRYTSQTSFHSLTGAKESWDCLHGPTRLAKLMDKYRRLMTYEGEGVWREDKAASAGLPQDGWCSWSSPEFLRGDSFLPPLKEGFTIALIWWKNSGTGAVLKWCNTKSCSSWHTIKNVGSGLGHGIFLKGVAVEGGRLMAKCCDENENEMERKWFISHGVVDLLRDLVVWEVLVEVKSQELEWWEFMK